MTTAHTNELVADYLRRLERAAAPLPRSRRAELVAEIREHIDDALIEAGAADEVAVRNVLERLGSPEEIAAAATPPADPTAHAGKLEVVALIALALPFVGWLVGIALLLASRAWSGRDKAIAALPRADSVPHLVARHGRRRRSERRRGWPRVVFLL